MATVYHSHDTAQQYRRYNAGYKFRYRRKNKPPHVYGRLGAICMKIKGTGKACKYNQNHQLRHQSGIQIGKVCTNRDLKKEKKKENSRQVKMRAFGRYDAYKYLKVLKIDTSKQKKRFDKNTSEEQEKSQKPNYIVET